VSLLLKPATRPMVPTLCLGVALSAASSGTSALGQTLQRLSRLKAEEATEITPPWWRPLWIFGVLLYACAALLDAASLFFAPMAIVLVMYAVKLPVVAFMATLLLRVRISGACIAGICVCACGSALSLHFAPKSSGASFRDPEDFLARSVGQYLAISACACGGLALCIWGDARGGANELRWPCGHAATPLLAAWVMSIEKLINSGRMVAHPPGKSLELQWLWMPLAMGCLGLAGGFLNLFGVEHQPTHVFVPSVFGFQACIMGLQSALSGEFVHMELKSMVLWMVGMLGAVVGTFVISFTDEHGVAGDSDDEASSEEGTWPGSDRDDNVAKSLPMFSKPQEHVRSCKSDLRTKESE